MAKNTSLSDDAVTNITELNLNDIVTKNQAITYVLYTQILYAIIHFLWKCTTASTIAFHICSGQLSVLPCIL